MDQTLDALLETLSQQLGRRNVDLGGALDQIRWSVSKTLGADRATLYLVDPVRKELVSRSIDLPGMNRIRLRLGEGLAGEVARLGQPLRMGRDDPRPATARKMDAQTGYRTRTMIAVPIHHAGRVIGVLQVLNKADGDFTEADEQRLTAWAAPLAHLLGRTSLAAQLDASARRPLEFQFNHIVGDAPPMRRLYDLVTRAARSDITVLVTGESGSGKTLVARALHDNSRRVDAPFVVVDCAAIPETLVENELFGHEAGAYTGADKAAEGKVGAAEGGTLFLDEVGDLSLAAQKKLLRLIQERTYYAVGGNRPRTADVRFVCATNRDLPAEVAAGRFRLDLMYRLRVVELRLPTLHERGADDLDRLIDHYMFEHTRTHARPGMHLTEGARRRLHAYAWPGNVRELRNVLEAAVVLAEDDALAAEDLPMPSEGLAPEAGAAVFQVPEELPMRALQAAYVRWVVHRCEGNRSEAARRLDISRTTLHEWLERT